jgi:hypothetical protein
MLVTAGTDPGAWGRAWHVPSNEALSQRQVIGDFARAAGVGQAAFGLKPAPWEEIVAVTVGPASR